MKPQQHLSGMGTDEREGSDRESAALLREVGRLRSLLQQAGIEAEQSSREISESERRYTHDIEGERANTQTARADADELRHRLKNTLAVVQAIANATLRPDVTLEDARAAFSARLQALADAHDILFESNWDSVGQQTIIDGILAPHRGAGLNRIRVRGPDVNLGAKPALALGRASPRQTICAPPDRQRR